MWNNYENTDMNRYETAKNLENETLFPNNGFKNFLQKKSTTSSPYDSNKKKDKLKFGGDSGGFF